MTKKVKKENKYKQQMKTKNVNCEYDWAFMNFVYDEKTIFRNELKNISFDISKHTYKLIVYKY